MTKLVAWIIEDDPQKNIDAQNIVQEIAEKKKKSINISHTYQFSWPLEFEDGPSNNHPNIVILDLFEGEETLRGEEIYWKIREVEDEEPNLHRTFVIIWSAYVSDKNAEATLNNALENDKYLILCAIKNKTSLLRAVEGCLGRIEEGE